MSQVIVVGVSLALTIVVLHRWMVTHIEGKVVLDVKCV